ncbi:YdcH family protein [Sphingomonas sp. R86521]|uniref:YdcH family protein n=1 Tax=Sphingomonas sp. R86521 TaxID=3093860 RepID=UPI0036D2F12C
MDEAQIKVRLDGMRIEHRDLDDAIAALSLLTVPDQMQMARLKRRKLRLRDEIAMLEDQLIPDIIA